tara:strand:+ start:4536 stop:4796 length:261 start_codon:yes stop_codon:yes gene_type:complete
MAQKKNQKSLKNNFDVDRYREEVITSLTALKVDNRNIKQTLIELRSLLREQNGRVRQNETAIGWMKGIMSVAFAVFSGFIAWLFNK